MVQPKPDVKIAGERIWSNPQKMEEEYVKVGWKRECVFEWIEYDHIVQSIKVVKYRIKARDFPCYCGAGSFGRFALVAPTGPILSCGVCRSNTQRVTNFDLFDILEERYVDIDEALRVMRRTNQLMPPKLKAELLRRNLTPYR